MKAVQLDQFGMSSNALNLPKVGQIGILVYDVEKTRAHYEKVYGIKPWIVFEKKPEFTIEKTGPVDATLKIATAYLGTVQLELIQVVSGRSYYNETLDVREGLHHLGFMVNDLEKRLEICKANGIGVLQRGQIKLKLITVDYAYLDTAAQGGIIFELIQTRIGPIKMKMNRLNHRISAWTGIQ
ncbi:MAG: hypothetical protein FJ118_02000 [Deltaproteobacteria bacterium]|nr:hypothetical protein [Deltaproteobacteria bacterium]